MVKRAAHAVGQVFCSFPNVAGLARIRGRGRTSHNICGELRTFRRSPSLDYRHLSTFFTRQSIYLVKASPEARINLG